MTCQDRPREKAEVWLLSIRNPALEWSGMLAPRFGRFTVGKKKVPIVRVTLDSAENIAATGIR